MRCNWLLAYPGRSGRREFEGCFNTLRAAQKMADRLNPAYCADPKHQGPCWRPVFNPPPGVTLRGPGRVSRSILKSRARGPIGRETGVDLLLREGRGSSLTYRVLRNVDSRSTRRNIIGGDAELETTDLEEATRYFNALHGPGRRKLTVPERHQLRIARGTLKMAPEMARMMGTMTRAEACRVIKQLTGKIPKEC